MLEVVDYLKRPELVARIQEYFGVRVVKGDDSKYEVTNKFWHHVFVLGTALGDEIFYSCFIPFWFWNVDGFVGRRVVLVWTIVMYIGVCNKSSNMFLFSIRAYKICSLALIDKNKSNQNLSSI